MRRLLARSASGSLFLYIGNDASPSDRMVTVTTSAGQSNAIPLTIRPRSGNFTISNLRATSPAGANGTFSLTVDFNDPSGSAANGVNYDRFKRPRLHKYFGSASRRRDRPHQRNHSYRHVCGTQRFEDRVGSIQSHQSCGPAKQHVRGCLLGNEFDHIRSARQLSQLRSRNF